MFNWRIDNFLHLIKLEIDLIHPIKGLIGELIKFCYLIKLGIKLINSIRSLIGELISFRLNWTLDLIKLMKSGT